MVAEQDTVSASTSMNICIFCSASDLPDEYTRQAKQLARLIAEHGYTLVWGGSDVGLMRDVSSAAQEAGGRIVGVSIGYLRDYAKQGADEMLITKDLAERKAMMLERADAIIVLVGGIGTLDELTEVLEHKKHRHHAKPVVVLNTNGFYDGFRTQLERMDRDGFLRMPLDSLIEFVDNPDDALRIVEQNNRDKSST